MLGKLLDVDGKDSLILCYYGEILSRIGRYKDAISYFTESNIVDPENVYNLNKRAIAYYVLQKYDKALLDLNKAAQLDPSNSLTYYYKGLINYAIKNVNDAMLAFKKCLELDPNDNLAKVQLYYLKYLPNNNDLDHNIIITKINQISNIYYNKSLLFMRCKVYIELEKYSEAKLDLDRLLMLNEEDISFIYLLRKYSGFWAYLYEIYNLNNIDLKESGIIDVFSKFIYKGKKYFL
jgi:tetratricopeptide (TPR) repeat protein